uniref:Uncharacterized protein n=1 Tax=Trichogramma kaykai TaxID=54128 RepID=A0ABD2XQR3_9HYME
MENKLINGNKTKKQITVPTLNFRAASIVILFIISRFLVKNQHPIDTLFDVTHPFTLNILTCSALYICAVYISVYLLGRNGSHFSLLC